MYIELAAPVYLQVDPELETFEIRKGLHGCTTHVLPALGVLRIPDSVACEFRFSVCSVFEPQVCDECEIFGRYRREEIREAFTRVEDEFGSAIDNR